MWIIIGICWLFTFSAQSVRWFVQQSAVLVHDQPIGSTFIVDRVRTPGPGVLIIVRSLYGKPFYEHILDRVELPQAGTYTNIQLTIAPQHLLGGRETLADTEGIVSPGSLVYAVLVYPWDSQSDPRPMRDVTGRPVARSFRLF